MDLYLTDDFLFLVVIVHSVDKTCFLILSRSGSVFFFMPLSYLYISFAIKRKSSVLAPHICYGTEMFAVSPTIKTNEKK